MKVWRSILLVGALLFIATATLTPGSPFASNAVRPDFWCFACGAEGGADVTLNFALFIPLGVALALLGMAPLRALVTGMLLSIAVESAQRLGWAPDRVAGATDLLTNTVGTFAGALVAWYRSRWINPSPRVARALASIGALTVLAFLAFTAWALSPDAGVNTTREQPSGFEISRFPYAPGYGWYHGRVSEATIDGVPYQHTGDGPVILRGRMNGSVNGTIAVSGRDERTGFVPLLYVHDLSVAGPELMLGQRGRDAQLEVRLRGRRVRFPGPSLSLREAFPEHTSDVQTLTFAVTSDLWKLSASSASATLSTTLPISLSLGWTLLQTVVHVGDRGASMVSIAWLFVLWLPIGYWCVLAGRAEAVAGVAVLVLTLWLLPAFATIARCSLLDWGTALGGMACGVFFGISKRNSSSQ